MSTTVPRDFQTKIVAFLGAADLPQKQIAELLGTSQSLVSRMLQEARDDGLLFTTCRLSPEDTELIQAHLFPERRRLQDNLKSLQPKSRDVLRAVHIFPSATKGGCQSEAGRLTTFATFAFRRFEAAASESQLVGIGWGRTIAALAAVMNGNVEGPKSSHSQLFFPLCGEPLNCPSTEFCASKNVASVSKGLSVEASKSLSLTAIPARFPKSCTPPRIRTIREFMQSSDAYRRIFTGDSACLSTADCMLLSGGTAATRRPDDPIVGDLLRFEELSEAALSRIASGDIAGALIPRQDLGASDRKLHKEIALRWNGVSCEQIAACALRAKESGAAGVMFFACGQAKTEIVIEAVRNSFVNEIVIDESLAKSLGTQLDFKPTS